MTSHTVSARYFLHGTAPTILPHTALRPAPPAGSRPILAARNTGLSGLKQRWCPSPETAAAGGEANIQVHHPALLHGSVRMSYSPSQKMGTMHFISWKYTTKNGKRLSILDTTKIYPSPFTNRLQISDDFYTLTIMDLTIEDGGIYIIDATDTNGETEDNSFNVTIYEPTPQPTITTHMEEITKERCNVTLNCSVPSQTSDLSYTWKSRHQNSTYQLYSNGRTIQISAPPDHQDMELLCIVQSPADQKNVSISVTPCTGTGKKIITPRSRNHIIIPILIIIIVILAITVAVIYIRTKHKGSSGQLFAVHYRDYPFRTRSLTDSQLTHSAA
ncbi:SLAM family member 9-like isoform X2 [Phyllobates terribilis]|uniref:SLAM family member 9-like isoform X2 n=1 Tax=Phyllobates terribilis TaxID=111132 RepID=UPI003CCB4D8E